jgi:hypothetical protein
VISINLSHALELFSGSSAIPRRLRVTRVILRRRPARARGNHCPEGGLPAGNPKPLQNWLVTPELQWQPRGDRTNLTGEGCRHTIMFSGLDEDELER